MKLILKQYLSSLRERGELDVIIPDLLSQIGLNVYSRPGRGTRQDGVDVGAIGSLDGGQEKVYLFSLKPGDLTRKEWDGNSIQSLRPSLNEIFDAYIPNRLPAEHRGKDIVICIGLGGDVQEQVRPLLTGFIKQNTTSNVTFEEWNGDKIASLIQSNFLREDLLPENARSLFRKSLALIDEPEASYKHFAALIKSLLKNDTQNDMEQIMALRQMSICIWVMFAWAREAENMESAYLSSELTLLYGWKIVSFYAGKKGPTTEAVQTSYFSIFSAYQQICIEFLAVNVLPHVGKLHALSSAVQSSCALDVNLKLFDLIGRLAIAGIWAYWGAGLISDEHEDAKQQELQKALMYMSSLVEMISNNPVLMLPTKDDQAIDIFIAASLLLLNENHYDYLRMWFAQIIDRANFTYQANGRYPCILTSYSDLLLHPKLGDDKYRENVTSGSILYPIIAIWAALLNDEHTYKKVSDLKQNHLQHCNFQYWYPDDSSEENFYTNSDYHGAILSHLFADRTKEELLAQVFGECIQSPHFKELSAVKFSWWPLIIVACRHYRLPPPLHFLESYTKNEEVL